MGVRRPQVVVLLLLPAAVLWRCFRTPGQELRPATPPRPGQLLDAELAAEARAEAEQPPELEAWGPEGRLPAPGGRRLVFEIDSAAGEHDSWGVGLTVDPILRKAKEHMFMPGGRAQLADMSRRQQLLDTGLTSFRQVLNRSFAAALRKRLQNLEQDLSKLPDHDLRWCHRYCKNMFVFAPALRAVAHTVGSAFLEQLGTSQLFLMNDEVSYNIHGEPHFDGWHLDVNAWLSLPDDAWGWTIYMPLDDGSRDAGGGWLRFRDKQDNSREWDEEFGPGDVLIFDRWIWHRLHDFIRERPPRLAYLLRVTNDTRVVDLPLAPQFHEPLAKRLPFPVGWQINYYCTPFNDPACRPPMGGDYDPERHEVRVMRFEVDADGSIDRTRDHSKEGLDRLNTALNFMGRQTLFDRMPDRRCEREAALPRRPAPKESRCSLWQRLRREASAAGSWHGAGALAGSAQPLCEEVVVELPPVLPRCVRWLHCGRRGDLVTGELVDKRGQGGFPDCLLLLPLLLWISESKGGRADALDDVLAIDVGANIGSCSLLMLAAGLRVAAFEPVAHNREHVRASAAQNPSRFRDRLVLLPYGLAGRPRTAFMVSQEGNAGNSHVAAAGAEDLQAFADDPGKVMLRSNEVALRRLDDLAGLPGECSSGTPGSVAVMKVDVQGFEFEVFSGAKELLRRGAVGAILFECEAERLAQHSQVDAGELFGLLRQLGFALMTQSGELFPEGSDGKIARQCGGLGLNLLALHSAVYTPKAGEAIANCLSSFWRHRGEQDFAALAAGGRCRSIYGLTRGAADRPR